MPNYPNINISKQDLTIPHIEIERNRSILHTPYLWSIKGPTHPQAGILPWNCSGMASSSTKEVECLSLGEQYINKKPFISSPLQEPGSRPKPTAFPYTLAQKAVVGSGMSAKRSVLLAEILLKISRWSLGTISISGGLQDSFCTTRINMNVRKLKKLQAAAMITRLHITTWFQMPWVLQRAL